MSVEPGQRYLRRGAKAFIRLPVLRSAHVLRRKPLGAAGLAVMLALVVLALFADQIATHDPLGQDIDNRLRAPGSDFFFGTDSFGRDTFSRVVHGARVSLYVGVVSVAIAVAAGAVLGVASAYFGGKLDLLFQRFVDGLMAFPTLVLALVLVAALGASANNVVLAIIIAVTPQTARLTRSSALSVRQEMYIDAAEAMGAQPWRVIVLHMLTNALTPVVVLMPVLLEQAIIAEAAMSFLGLGVPPPEPSWGRMLKEGTDGYLEAAPWLTYFPALALTLTVFSASMIGDALRDILDPRFASRSAFRPAEVGRVR